MALRRPASSPEEPGSGALSEGARYGIVRSARPAGGSDRHNAGPGTPREAPVPRSRMRLPPLILVAAAVRCPGSGHGRGYRLREPVSCRHGTTPPLPRWPSPAVGLPPRVDDLWSWPTPSATGGGGGCERARSRHGHHRRHRDGALPVSCCSSSVGGRRGGPTAARTSTSPGDRWARGRRGSRPPRAPSPAGSPWARWG